MDTLYKNSKCGKQLSGYGHAKLEENVKRHEAFCPLCNTTQPEMMKSIVETISSSDERLIKTVPKVEKTRGKTVKKKVGKKK